MSVVPPRQVVVLSIANYDEICSSYGEEVCANLMDLLRECAIGCGVDPEHMRRFDEHTLLLRLDSLAREVFLQTVQCMVERTRGLSVPGVPDAEPRIRVGAMSERAMRAFVNDVAFRLLSYMNHTDCPAAFLAGDELDIWQKLEASGVEFMSYEQLKNIDPFTGLLMVDRFMMLLQNVLDDPGQYGRECKVLFFDIDDFKSYNRTFNHEAGDKLLLFVARELASEFPTDVVAHFSIDRFAVLTNSPDVVRKVATIHERVRSFHKAFAPEIKCGIFKLEESVTTAAIALDCAKLACESIKGQYDASYCLFGENLKERLFTRRYVARNAERAVNEHWVHAFAQPVVDTQSEEVCGFEALARWDDPERGLLSPAVFIPTLEDAHLIHKLDGCIVDEVCRHLAERMRNGERVHPASVNLSRLDFQLCDIFSLVNDACARWGIPHEMLAVEVTESAMDDEGSNLRGKLDQFRDAGFEVWMDDFGCGYSSLNLLKDYEFDVLKVDMEFLRDMEGNERSKTIVISVLEMARDLGIRTLVEGVETPAQRDFLREAGCDMMQGYLFGRPQRLSAADL